MTAYLRDPAAIYAQSFATIRAEADLSHLPAALHDVAIRMIHACGMVDIAADIVGDPDLPTAVRRALDASEPVLCDSHMVRAGIIRSGLPRENDLIVTLDDAEIPELAKRLGTTRSAAAVELWRNRIEGAVCLIGNAPTALFHLLEMLEAGSPKPAAIIATPVGFVGATESKDLLAAGTHSVPFITLLGRRGGSAIAAAALNAIARGRRIVTPWLTIIGVGEGELPPLPPAQTVLGPRRLLDRLQSATLSRVAGEGDHAQHGGGGAPNLIEWTSPLDSMLDQVRALRGTPTLILATGDPMWFGIGATLAREFDPSELRIHAHPSAFQLAAAHLRWPLQHVTTLSLHGRPAELIHPHILPGSRILALTSDAATATHVARLLVERGYGGSMVTLLANLGSDTEIVASAPARDFALDLGDFYVLAVDCVADADAPLLPPVPGLPDDAFLSDGQITKREIRAATIARLAPYPGALLWDVGAGCGSIAIEWMRAARDARAIAFEREGERLQMIAVNAERLGVPGLRIENEEAPRSLTGMPTPDAIFLGGDVANETLFQACWSALRPGGRFVANAVTLEGEQALYDRQSRFGGELVRIDIAVLDAIGSYRALRPRMPVTQWSVVKP